MGVFRARNFMGEILFPSPFSSELRSRPTRCVFGLQVASPTRRWSISFVIFAINNVYKIYLTSTIYKHTHTLVVYMFTCFQGGVGQTLLGSHPWKTLSGCIQLDRNKFTCFLHSIGWSSTYIKDLDRVDSILLGVSQQDLQH